MARTPKQKQTPIPQTFLHRPSYTRRPSTPPPELPPRQSQTTPEVVEEPTAAALRGRRSGGVYKKSYHQPYPVDVEKVLNEATQCEGEELDRAGKGTGDLGLRVSWKGNPVAKKKEGVRSPEMAESISVRSELRKEVERQEKERKEGDQREKEKRNREDTTEKEEMRKKQRKVGKEAEIMETDADEGDLISLVGMSRGASNATDSTGTVFPKNGSGRLEILDLTGLDDSDSEYVEVSDFSEKEEEEEEEEEEPRATPMKKKILVDTSQSPSPARLPSPTKQQVQKRRPVKVPILEQKGSRKKHANGLYYSSDSRSASPSSRPLTPRAGVGLGKRRRVSPHNSSPKKQRVTSSGYTLPPTHTNPVSPTLTHHKHKTPRSPGRTTRSPSPQPPRLRISLKGNDEIVAIPFSEVLTPAELEGVITTCFPQPADTYIKLTDDRGDIIKLSFWKGGVWKDGLRVRVEYRDNTAGGSGSSRTSTGAGSGSKSSGEKMGKARMVDTGVQTEEVEVNDVGWAKKRTIEMEEEMNEQLQLRVEQEVKERLTVNLKQELDAMGLKLERERELERLREENERQKQRQREMEEEADLELHFGNTQPMDEKPQDIPALPSSRIPDPPQNNVKETREAAAEMSVGAWAAINLIGNTAQSMPTPTATAYTSRNSSTDLPSPTKLQFTTLPPPLATARAESPTETLQNPQQKQKQQTKVLPKKWRPSMDANDDRDMSGAESDLSLDLSWGSQKKRAAAAERNEKQKSKSKTKSKEEKNPPHITPGEGFDGESDVPSWVLSSAKKQKSRESSHGLSSLNSTPVKRKGQIIEPPSVSPARPKPNPRPVAAQSKGLSLFLESGDSSGESSPWEDATSDAPSPHEETAEEKLSPKYSDSAQAPVPTSAPVTPRNPNTAREGGASIGTARRSGKASPVRSGIGSGRR